MLCVAILAGPDGRYLCTEETAHGIGLPETDLEENESLRDAATRVARSHNLVIEPSQWLHVVLADGQLVLWHHVYEAVNMDGQDLDWALSETLLSDSWKYPENYDTEYLLGVLGQVRKHLSTK